MKAIVSSAVFGLSVVLLGLAIVVTPFWLDVLLTRNGIPALIFIWYVVPGFLGTSLLLSILPSAILYKRGHQRRDLLSLRMSAGTFLLIGLEAAVMVLALMRLRFSGPGG
jgi:hypothetical protein